MTWWTELKTEFRRHDFDLDTPQRACIMGSRYPLHVTVFRCRACGKMLSLDRANMIDLPWAQGRGCPGGSNQRD